MTKISRIQPWRRLAEVIQAVIIIGLPFVRINDESALRFDVPTLQLHFFGLTLWMEEFFIVLAAIIFLSLLIVFVTLLFGRVWCGWMCPQTVIADFTAFAAKAKVKGFLNKSIAYSATFLISILVAANLIWYFVSPYEFIPSLFKGNMGNVTTGFWAVLTVIIFLNFILLRHKFCATVCPYAKLQGTLFDDRTLIVAFDSKRKEECMDCMVCVKACPVGIDIRDGLDAACIHCAECIDRCADMMKPRQRKSLIGYFFGQPGETGGIFRQNAVLTGTVTAAFLILFLYLLVVRVPLDMAVLPNYAFQPRIKNDDSVINSYILSIKNRGKADAELKLKVQGNASNIRIIPDSISRIKAGEMIKLPVYIIVRDIDGQEPVKYIDIIVESIKGDKLRITESANFIIPET